MFSQSGSEIVNISKKLGTWPDIVVTNNKDESSINNELKKQYIIHYTSRELDDFGGTGIDSAMLDLLCEDRVMIVVDTKLTKQVYTDILGMVVGQFIITLNGWLKIVPKSITKDYFIYNGHPGLVSKFPELAGLDPQQKVIDRYNKNDAYTTMGSIIHLVTDEIDGGPILASKEVAAPELPDDVFSVLHDTSCDLWVKFLRSRLLGFSDTTLIDSCIVGLYPYHYASGQKFFSKEDIELKMDNIEPIFGGGISVWELLAFREKLNWGLSR